MGGLFRGKEHFQQERTRGANYAEAGGLFFICLTMFPPLAVQLRSFKWPITEVTAHRLRKWPSDAASYAVSRPQ